jgi:putative nucleotidyltransferase with HDIG domain
MTDKGGQGGGPSGMAALRNRSIIPLGLTLLVLVYEFAWKGSLVSPGSWAERLINLALFLLVGPAMAWWGQSMARVLLRRLVVSEAASEEKSRLLELRNRQLQSILQASRAMTSVLDLPQVADLVVEQLVSFTRFTRAALILGPAEDGTYAMAGACNLPDAYLREFITALQGPLKASSPVEWCRVTRQPVVVENLAKDFRTTGLRHIFALASVEGMIAVPLIYGDQFRGALTVYLDNGGPIATAEISLVSALATQSALALENARLYTQKEANRARLDKALEFLQCVASVLARTRVGVVPLLHLIAQVTAKLFAPARVTLTITRSGRPTPLVVTESAGLEGAGDHLALSMPVSTMDGEQFGQFEVYLSPTGRELDTDEIQILQAFVYLTASALGNASLVVELRQAVDEVERAYMSTLEALTKALEMRDHETEGHSRRVVQYTLSLAQKLCAPEDELVPIMRGALLHDIGKIGIPDAILKKQGPLSPAEWEIMRQHPRIGFEMLKGIEFIRRATPIILHHHERYDGSGYPQQLAGDAIPLGARIFAVADAYDAITSDRPYRKGRGHEVAVGEIVAGSGKQFDPQVVAALLALPQEELARIRGRDLSFK